MLGPVIVLIPFCIVILRAENECSGTSVPIWNANDYQSNSDYYKNFGEDSLTFNQAHNLRLDRLSWPRFDPSDGSSVIYLRRQYYMPDCNGSSTTLHWISLDSKNMNKPIQLTRPIWGIHDQQVRT